MKHVLVQSLFHTDEPNQTEHFGFSNVGSSKITKLAGVNGH